LKVANVLPVDKDIDKAPDSAPGVEHFFSDSTVHGFHIGENLANARAFCLKFRFAAGELS